MAAPKKTAKKTAAKTTAKKTAAKKTTAKKTTAKKTTAKKTTAKKTTAKKPAGAKKTAAKKPLAKKAAAKKAAAKKPLAKRIDPHDTGATVPERRASMPAPPMPKKTPEDVRRDASRALALAVASAGLDKKAERIEIIDVCGKADYTDFLVLMSGRSDRQVQSIAQGIEGAAEALGERSRSTEGMRQGQWVIVDFGDVLVHVFLEEERRHRDLESLWMDARRVPLETPGATSAT
ncbi:MAG: ribosome silencing factor [Polyangiales bacterium]